MKRSVRMSWSKIIRIAERVIVFCFCFALLAVSAKPTNSPKPFLESAAPVSALPGSSNLLLKLTGAGFVSGATVNWNGSPLSTVFVSAQQLVATVPAGLLVQTETARISVVNPPPGGGGSNILFFSVTNPESSINFTSSTVPTGAQPQAIATADFNGDGIVDLAVVNFGDGSIAIYFGTANGTFQQQATLNCVCEMPDAIAVGDVNNDGIQDFVVTAFGNGQANVFVFLGNGDGTFKTPTGGFVSDSPEFAEASAIAMADFDGDGNLDLAVTNAGDNNVSIFLGNGDGTFRTSQDYGAGDGPVALAVGDFNRDGFLDLAVSNLNDGSISILLGNGDGTFTTQAPIFIGETPALATADVDGDGNLDLLVVDSTSAAAAVLIGNGDGTFKSPVLYDLGLSPSAIAVGDFNGDGKLDIAATNAEDGSVSILSGNGDGTFAAQQNFSAGDYPLAVLAADVNNDGRVDLVVVNTADDDIAILLQPSTELTVSPTELDFATQVVGTTSNPLTVTLTNTGTNTITFAALATAGDFSVVVGGPGACSAGSTLSSKGSCLLSVTFSPSQAGPQAGALSITDNASGSPQSIPLKGSGIAASATVTVSPSSLTFGNQTVGTTSTPQTVTLTNSGMNAITFRAIATTGDFSVVGGSSMGGCTPTGSLVADASCQVIVTFSPSQTGARTGTLTFTDSALGSPQIVPLTGTALSASGSATVSPSSLEFAPQVLGTTSASEMITVSNLGSSAVSVGSLAANGDFAMVTGNHSGACSAGAVLVVNGSCSVSVTFLPTQSGKRVGTFAITFSSAASEQVSLLGVGVDFALIAQPSQLEIHSGDSGSFAITGQSIGGPFNSTVALSVSGLPTGMSATFIPASLTPGSGSASSTLLIANSAHANPASERVGREIAALGMILWVSLCGGALLGWNVQRRPDPLQFYLAVFVLCTTVFGMSACAGGFPGSNLPREGKNYVLTIQGKSGALEHSTTVQLTLR